MSLPSAARDSGAAQGYASRNDATLTSCVRTGLEVEVAVVTRERLGEAAEPLQAEDFQGAQRSRARLDAAPLGLGSVGGLVGGVVGGVGGRIANAAWNEFKDEFADGPLDIVSLGSFLRGHGFQVGEHPAFGGVCSNGCHTDGSWHYRNGAIDVNFGVGQSPAEMAAIDPLIPHLRELGYGVIWRTEDHWDHLHVDLGGARQG